MVKTNDMCTDKFESHPPAACQNKSIAQVISRRLTGKQLKAVMAGLTPADGDSFRVLQVGKSQMVGEVVLLVIKADTASITVTIGYDNGTNTSAAAFLGATNLNAIGCTVGAVKTVLFEADGYYITITPATVTTLVDATEIIVSAEIIDFSTEGIAATLTAPTVLA